MKKSLKIFTTLLVVVMMVSCMSVNVLAAGPEDEKPNNPAQTVIAEMEASTKKADTKGVTDIGKQITDILTTVGIVVAVIVLMVIGIKYMMGSAEEKAEYKKVMIPYIVGIVILLSASVIVKMIAGFKL